MGQVGCMWYMQQSCRVGTNKGKELGAEIGTQNWKETDD